VIERSHRRICCPQKGRGRKRERVYCGESVRIGKKKGKEIQNLRREEMEDHPQSNPSQGSLRMRASPE